MLPSIYENNRQRLAQLMSPGAIAIFNSNDVLPTNADGTFPFKQNNDLLYLCGIEQEQTILLLYPDAPNAAQKVILFIQRNDEERRKWHGHQLSAEEACAISGIASVYTLDEFSGVFQAMMSQVSEVYLNRIEHSRAKVAITTRDDRFGQWCRKQYPLHQYKRLAPLMAELRLIKQPYEIELMKKAAAITAAGFHRVLKTVRAGVHQKQIEAEMIYTYLYHGATWADYQPIVASGIDTCTLHYNTNHKVVQTGELVLIDAACSHSGYQSDVTRTIPVDGRFTKRQLEVYQAVLAVHQFLRINMKAGISIPTWQAEGRKFCAEQIRLLNLKGAQNMGDEQLLNQYAYHGFAHYLGLDVHDVGDLNTKLSTGMVLTNEPGIYIKEEGFGIRLENNLWLSNNGVVDLTATIPIEAEEIESLMAN